MLIKDYLLERTAQRRTRIYLFFANLWRKTTETRETQALRNRGSLDPRQIL